jgi:RHS repeat-associated protein
VAGACAATPPVARVTVTPTRILRDDAHRTLVTLDASGSTGSGLSFAWTIPDARLEPGSSFSDATVRVRLPGTGDHPWSLRVRNSGGESSVAGVVRTNRRPVAIAESVGITRPGTAVSASGTRSFDGDGDPLSYHWTFRTRPTGSSATLMGATSATASFVPDVVGTYVLSLVVRDGLEDSEAAATHVVVEGSDIDRPTVTVTARPAAVGAVASAFTLCVNATDASPIDSRSLTVAGATVSLGSDGCGSWSSTTAGRFEAVGIARDRQGNLGRGTLALFVHASPRGTPPTVALTAPAEGAVLSAPTDVVGTATDTDLAEWTLELTPVQGSSAQIVARGNTSVSTARLAALVPNALAPGMYDLRLCAEDTHGQRACTPPRPIEIAERGIRPGALRIGVLDAVQDLLGVSLQLARIYDSRFRAVGDFGYGWTLETSAHGRIHVMTDPSTGWAETGSCARLPFRPSFRENRLHRWTVTIGREQQRFRMNLVPGACITGGVQLSINFTPESGSTGSLVTLDGSDGLLYLHSDQTIYFDDLTPWNPRRFRYTSTNGVVYEFDVGRGLTAFDDGAGTRIEFGASGITVAGASIGLTRDSQQRITRLTLPDGRARTYRYDNAGDLVGATDFAGQETRYRYDLDHRLIEVIDPRGAAPASLTFDNEGRVTGLRDATGHTVELRWDTPQRHVTTDRLGHTTTYNYDSNGNVTSVVDALGNTRSFTYDSNLRMTSATDPLGNVTRYEYDARGNQTAIVDPLGHRWTSTYDAQGRLTARSDPTGAVERFEYDARGHMTGYVNPLGGRMAFVNDSRGRPTRITNPAGGVLALTRDSTGRLTGYTDALGGTGTVLSRPDGEVARETFRFGGRDVSWEQVFDMAGRLTGGTTPDGASWTLGYDRAGAVEHFTDTEGRTQRFVLDASGTLTAMVAGDGRSVTLTRDREDRIVGATLPHGGTAQRSLDALGRPTRVVLPNGITLSTGYDAAGRVTSQSTTFGGVERFTYDAAGRPTGATLPNGATIAYEYDAAGRRTALVDALGRRTTFGYDALGNLTRVTFPDGAATTSSFDSSGRLTSFVDERGATLRFTYDAANQLIGAQSAAGETTTYTYDGAGGLAGATMPSGATWSFTRSATGALRSVRTPWGGETQWERLPNGRITRTIDPTGTVLRYEYDDAGRMTARVPPTASEAERRSFGAGGRVLAATGPSGMTTWAYDAQGRVRRVTHPDGSFVEYTYDARGRRATVQTPAGTTRYLYDDNTGWLTAVEDTLGGRSSFTYDAAGRLTGEVLADGTRHTLTRNLRGQRTHDRLTDAGGSVLWEESYTRDPAGNVTRANETVSGRAVDYSYDTAGRVAREVRTGPDAADEHYAYDRDDNLTRIGARTFTIDRTRLMSDGSVTYTYDAAGRRTGRSGAGRTETYRYDAFDRLVEVTRTGATPARVTLAYDANGLLRSIEADGVRRTLLWDSERVVPVLLEERDGAGRLLAHYVHGTHPLAVVGEGGSVAVLHRDGLGSVRVRTEGGRVVSRFGYSAFGAPTLGASDPTRLRHAGEYWIPELGLTYLRARFYDPAVGRFLTPDPRAPEPDAPTTFNPYTYAGNNPVRFTDPRGEFSLGNVSIAVSVVSTLASIALPNFDIAGFFVRGLGLDVPFTDIVGVNVQLGLSYGAGSFGAGGGLSLDYASSGGTTLRAVSMFVTFSLQFGGNNIARTFPRNRIEAIAQTGPIFGDASEPQSEPTCNAALAISGGLAQKVVQYFRTRGLGLSFANDAWRRSAFELSFGIFDNIRVSRSGVSANWSFSLRKFGFGATALPNVTSSIFDGTSRQDIDLSPRTDYFSAISSYLYIPLWHSLDNRQFPNIWEMLGAMLF